MKFFSKHLPVVVTVVVCVFVVICIGSVFAQKATHALPDGGTMNWGGQSDQATMGTATTGSINENYETPSAECNVLLVVKVMEPCSSCSQMIGTGPTWTNSATYSFTYPMVPVTHSYWFKTIGAALAKAEKENWEVTWLAVTRPMPFDMKSVEERVKQPDVVTTKRHYTLKESQ